MVGSANVKFIGDVMVSYSAHCLYKENQATSKSFYKQDKKWEKRQACKVDVSKREE